MLQTMSMVFPVWGDSDVGDTLEAALTQTMSVVLGLPRCVGIETGEGALTQIHYPFS